MIVNVRHTGIVVTDLPRAVSFYSELGFIEFSRDIESGEFIEQVTGMKDARLEWVKLKAKDGYLLELLQYHSHPGSSSLDVALANQLGCSHLAYTVEDIDAACQQILRAGGSLVNPPAISANGKVKVAYCHDPEGVLMEIVQEL
jgi:predicted enzyme related to lactoylglutathione lyase